MSDLSYNIGLIPAQDTKWAAGTGYVFIPSDIARDEFITNCYIQGTISIRTEDGGVYHNCPASRNVFNEIYWPELEGQFGSIVTYVLEPRHQQPIVVALLNPNDQVVDLKESQFKIGRKTSTNIAEIAGENNPVANIIMYVEGRSSSTINIIAANDTQKADITLDSAGTLNCYAVSNLKIKSQSEIELTVGETAESSSSIIQSSSFINANTSKFQINKGSEAFILGNKMKAFLDDLVTEISQSTVTTSLGQMPLLNAAQIAKYKTRTTELLSEISFTD